VRLAACLASISPSCFLVKRRDQLAHGSRDIEHIGSAHAAAEVELLRAAARQKLTAGQARQTCETSRLAQLHRFMTAASGGKPPVPHPQSGGFDTGRRLYACLRSRPRPTDQDHAVRVPSR
jgi:hypothetical protein